jgi:hypothetical protein
MAVNHFIGCVVEGYGTGPETYSGTEQQGDGLGHFEQRIMNAL